MTAPRSSDEQRTDTGPDVDNTGIQSAGTRADTGATDDDGDDTTAAEDGTAE